MNIKLLFFSSVLVASLLSGCVTTTNRNVSLRQEVTATLPPESALRYLKSAPHEGPGTCRIGARGLSGLSYSAFGTKPSGFRAFDNWRIYSVGTSDVFGLNFTSVTLILNADGLRFNCNAYFRKGTEITPGIARELNKTVTALVSLGVQYDPAKLGQQD